MKKKFHTVILIVVIVSSVVYSNSYLGTDLCFTHIIKNKTVGSTADAMPNFNLFLIKPINEKTVFIEDIHYQWNVFTDGGLKMISLKTNVGCMQGKKRTMSIEYVGIAPSIMSLKGTNTEAYGSSYNTTVIKTDFDKFGMALNLIAGIRQIFGKNRFFSFGWTAEYDLIVPFFKINDIFPDASSGLSCVKAGFSFTFQLPK
jgi:hypothetical protein